MTTTPNLQDLDKQIEHVVQEHIAASHKAAAAALERAFGASAVTPTRTPRSSRSGKSMGRRPPSEIAALGERLYQAVCAKPGEGMAVLAADVGASPRDLHLPMMRLKGAGQISSVGKRHLTRYFPLVSEATGSA